MPENILLIACGTFNPPTPMHFRIFEIARDYFHSTNKANVIGGIVSPAHDLYKKSNVKLVSAEHRCRMIPLSLRSSEWIRLSKWEVEQENWLTARGVIQYHQNFINSLLNDTNEESSNDKPCWIPPLIDEYKGQQVRVKLLCGADLLESFANKRLWNDSDLRQILEDHGIVVINRHGFKPDKFVFDSDLLYANRQNITIIDNWVPNEINSKLIRLHLLRQLSVKYLLCDKVIAYIHSHDLYGSDSEVDESEPEQRQSEKIVNTTNIIIIGGKYQDVPKHGSYEKMDETDGTPKKNLSQSVPALEGKRQHLEKHSSRKQPKRKMSRARK